LNPDRAETSPYSYHDEHKNERLCKSLQWCTSGEKLFSRKVDISFVDSIGVFVGSLGQDSAIKRYLIELMLVLERES